MAPELGEVLRGLCRGGGWSYGVLWRVDPHDPRLLVMGDRYYEQQIGTVIDKMINQVHMVGEGTLGTAARSGEHHWIYSDTHYIESSPTSPSDNVEMFQGNTAWQHQFLTGLKTIAIISLPSLGVVQFGSTQKVCESLEFINQVQSLFRQPETMTQNFLHGGANKDMNLCDTPAALSSVMSSHESINSLVDVICKEQQANAVSSSGPIQTSDLFSLGSQIGSTNPQASAMPVISSSTGASKSFSNSFQKLPFISSISSLYLTDNVEAQVLLPPNNNLRSNFGFPDNSTATYLNANRWDKEIGKLPMPEQRLLNGLAMQGNPSRLPTNSHSSVPHMNAFQYFCGDSISSHSPCGSQGMMHGTRSSKTSEPCHYGEEKLLDFQHSSSFLPVCSLSAAKSFSSVPFFTPDLPDNFLTFPQCLTPEGSASFHSKDDSLNDEIHLCDQPSEQVSDGPTVPTKDNFVCSKSVSCGLVQNEATGCTPTTDSPSRLVENSVTGAVNSLDTGCKWKKSSSDAPTQMFSDNDLFEGMELDLSPRMLGQESWDDIIMPVGSGSCSNLSTNVSRCISDMNMGSMVAADKGLFSEPSLEKLLDAVVGGSANLSSSHRSVTTNISSVAGLNSEHQFLTVTKVDGPQVYTNPAPLITLPSLIRTSDVSLPECNLEKIMKGSPKDALSKSHVSVWIDDSCSMNAESAVINQPKKREESAKVARKRARPGESTRPRPKDRQRIQDRVKELREIVPSGAKCSIDALLDRTIKHVLFLQSVTKYADKLKQADEPMMIGEESGVVLRDNSSVGSGGSGATWAYEVAGQAMVCPILVEDLNPPGQILAEMLCEERGLFLEIAFIICGFGLTILKGVMEVRDSKIWARFLVEANRDVTRMDIFFSLVQLLQQTSSIRSSEQQTKAVDKGAPTLTNYQQSPVSIPIQSSR